MGYSMQKMDIKGEVYSTTIKVLVDSGSKVTLINSDVAREMEMAGLNPVNLIGPKNEPLSGFLAFATLRIVGTPYTVRQKVVVINKTVFSLDALAGMDFITAAKIGANHQQFDIKCDKCSAPLDTCDCTWLPFKFG